MSSQDFKELRVALTTKPGATLYAALRHPNPSSSDSNPLADTLVVFLNGLLLPSATWSETISHLLSLRKTLNQPTPAILCYDRYGQGKSDPDPTDDLASDPDYGHGPLSSIADLHQLLQQLSHDELHIPLESLRLILVCNSIGCALARLYAATYHTDSRIVAYVFLDSMMANTDFVSIFPDPDKPEFDKRKLPKGVTPNDLRHARLKFRQYFHPDVPNAERLDRRALRDLLPLADGPALPQGLGGSPPLLTVVGHDWEEFAEQCERGSLAVSKEVINAYMNPAWTKYNEGLIHLTTPPGELKIAKDCGHFIQKDDPEFVANEINDILNRIVAL